MIEAGHARALAAAYGNLSKALETGNRNDEARARLLIKAVGKIDRFTDEVLSEMGLQDIPHSAGSISQTTRLPLRPSFQISEELEERFGGKTILEYIRAMGIHPNLLAESSRVSLSTVYRILSPKSSLEPEQAARRAQRCSDIIANAQGMDELDPRREALFKIAMKNELRLINPSTTSL